VFNLSLPQTDLMPPQASKAARTDAINLSLPPADALPKPAKPVKASAYDLSLSAPVSVAGDAPPLQEKVQQDLQSLLADLLNVTAKEIDPVANFGEFGLDSIVVTEYIGRINHLYALNVILLALVDYPSLNALAAYLCQAYPQALAQYYD
jgi:acyl carrier protein